jgi:hypothetical protein
MAESTLQPAGYKPLLTKKETAGLFAVSERTVDRWLLESILPADAKIIVGGSVRFRTTVLLDHINAQGCVSDAS